jgi:hypothetical protein
MNISAERVGTAAQRPAVESAERIAIKERIGILAVHLCACSDAGDQEDATDKEIADADADYNRTKAEMFGWCRKLGQVR